ncbi:PHD finger protein 20-like protein 1 isoform X2 [Bombina bombina]|uniref:PHD finger protein 20-like protein 1 isoform X2 n=1 Tax=Bombina bombina TaxID=8345 RepID=UPI00235A9112|nr:PHD finger protein 20-like protein 1 isoform X2 [Bombina bombina]
MSKDPPSRPGITFEIGARLEAQDYLQKWYTSKIEKIDYEEGKMLIHFERWSSRYDEWIHWDSNRIRPLEQPALRKEGLKDDEEIFDFREGDEVLARWTDCRYYPAKIETINKEGTYTVQFYDGVIRCLKKMHIKYMPEDAKGQDWIALVKAAAAAAKHKPGSKPRTSANSNKEKEERKSLKGSSKKEELLTCKPIDIFKKEEEEPTSSKTLENAIEEVPKMSLQQRDDELLLKRKITQASSFQAKRARLNKITGLLASKAVVLEDAGKKEHVPEKTLRLEEAISSKPQSQKPNEADISCSGITMKSSRLPPVLSSGKARSRKDKSDPGDIPGCKKSPISHIAPEFKQGTIHSAQPMNLCRSSARNNRRRRSHRVAPSIPLDFTSASLCDGKGLQKYQMQQELSIAMVTDVAYMPPEKLEHCVPLDLSRSAEVSTPLVIETNFHIDCPSKEKENIQTITFSTKAVAEGKIASTSSVPLSKVQAVNSEIALPNSLKTAKGSKKKKSPGSVNSEISDTFLTSTGIEKVSDNLQEKVLKKVIEKDKHSEVGIEHLEKKVKTEEKATSIGKKKDKERREKKDKDHSKSKQKKKKKKKKKSKQHEYSDYEDSSVDYLERCTSPVTRSSSCTLVPRNLSNTSFQYPRAILSVDLTGENLSDMEILDDSSTESLIFSGDEYNQDFDSTNFEESQDEEVAINEVVRCVCEMDEENGFMIQCEECLCWQHSVCMGLLEDSIPEQYTCYVCSDPPGQRWNAKCHYDKDWFNNGRMCGLSFINENYSYLNAKKIVSTHRLLADVYGVTKVLHGLQLKFGILKKRNHPDLRSWACSGAHREQNQINDKRTLSSHVAMAPERKTLGQNHKGPPSTLYKKEETYITSEHSYQKPQSSEHSFKSLYEPALANEDCFQTKRSESHMNTKKCLQDSTKIEKRNEQTVSEETVRLFAGKKAIEEQVESHLQWQLNLLTHIENIQNEITSRMDLIEKEVDVLESWLDFTGELEPPDPLARLPQLKRRIKQLLKDMSKVQQIATLCSV